MGSPAKALRIHCQLVVFPQTTPPWGYVCAPLSHHPPPHHRRLHRPLVKASLLWPCLLRSRLLPRVDREYLELGWALGRRTDPYLSTVVKHFHPKIIPDLNCAPNTEERGLKVSLFRS